MRALLSSRSLLYNAKRCGSSDRWICKKSDQIPEPMHGPETKCSRGDLLCTKGQANSEMAGECELAHHMVIVAVVG